MVRDPNLPLSRVVSTAEITGSLESEDMKECVLTVRSRSEPLTRVRPCTCGRGPVFDRDPQVCHPLSGTRPEGHYRGSAGAADRFYLVGCSVVNVAKCAKDPPE